MNRARDKIQFKLAQKSTCNFLTSRNLATICEFYTREDMNEVLPAINNFLKIGSKPKCVLSKSSLILERKSWFLNLLDYDLPEQILIAGHSHQYDTTVWTMIKDFGGADGLFLIWEHTGYRDFSIYDRPQGEILVIFADKEFEAFTANLKKPC